MELAPGSYPGHSSIAHVNSPHSRPGSSDWRDWPTGTRVVVRRRLSEAEAAASHKRWTDVIGVVVAVDDDGVTLRRDPARAGAGQGPAPDDAGGPGPDDSGADSVVHVPASDIEAAKVLPPRPERRRGRAG